jgi:hypothetical protein
VFLADLNIVEQWLCYSVQSMLSKACSTDL